VAVNTIGLDKLQFLSYIYNRAYTVDKPIIKFKSLNGITMLYTDPFWLSRLQKCKVLLVCQDFEWLCTEYSDRSPRGRNTWQRPSFQENRTSSARHHRECRNLGWPLCHGNTFESELRHESFLNHRLQKRKASTLMHILHCFDLLRICLQLVAQQVHNRYVYNKF